MKMTLTLIFDIAMIIAMIIASILFCFKGLSIVSTEH